MTRIIAVIVGLILVSATANAADSPFFGTWRLNPAKSHMTNPRQAGLPRLDVFAPYGNDGLTRVTINDANPNVSGAEEHFSAKFDGKDYPLNGADPKTITLARVDRFTINIMNKRRGKVTSRHQLKISPDGRTLTITSTGVNAVGVPYSGQVAVYDRLQ
jgi:hypothetical protein